MSYLGIDLGTSSVKVVAVSETGAVLAVQSVGYPTDHPSAGAAEQDPGQWWEAVGIAVRALPDDVRSGIEVLGLSGQMHGTVCLDRNRTLLRPAIIWSDVRGADNARSLTDRIGKPKLADLIGTPLATGFQAVTLDWLRETDSALFDQIETVLLPKDWLRLNLVGEISTEPSDAASTGLLEVHERRWASHVLDAIGLRPEQMPRIGKSAALSGVLTSDAQAHLGLNRAVPVCGGGGDASLAAIASGVSGLGHLMLTLSSGAQATSFIDAPNVDFPLRAHTFASPLDPDVDECGWYVMGATMAAGMALQWLKTNVLGQRETPTEQLITLADQVSAGADGLIFVPYLAGERTPHMDALARGGFIGLTADHNQRHLVRAVLEGTVFALADAFDLVAGLTLFPDEIVVAGGGARSTTWVQIVADILDRPVRTSSIVDQSAVGAAVLAAAADTGRRASAIGREWATFDSVVEPNRANVSRYHELRTVYSTYYPAFADQFPVLHGTTAAS